MELLDKPKTKITKLKDALKGAVKLYEVDLLKANQILYFS